MKKAGWMLAIVFLVSFGIVGLLNVRREMTDAQTALQMLVGVAQGVYGVFGLVGGIGLARRRPWSVWMAGVWAIAGSTAATVASFAFEDPHFERRDTVIGTISAFLSTVVMGALIIWAARIATRPAPASAATTT